MMQVWDLLVELTIVMVVALAEIGSEKRLRTE